ncbi:MAG TPA: nitroreductase family deazaflavin-dependent oxidoreductase [Candidatus Limnocylindrales bacterium]|jgi:deazaflavin-dependent oxidoreductase (nitroreductase family)
MTVNASQTHATTEPREAVEPAPKPRFGGVFWRISRLTRPVTLPLAGKRWNPIFAVIEHRGRKTGRVYRTPVAARRRENGFLIALAFGAQVDWYRNLVAAGGGTIRWRGDVYSVTSPERVAAATVLTTFDPVQRLLLRIAGIDGYVQVRDAESSHA